jgi:uncharacterized membrane protein
MTALILNVFCWLIVVANLVLALLLQRKLRAFGQELQQVRNLRIVLMILAVDGWKMRPWAMALLRRAIRESEAYQQEGSNDG